MTFLIVPMVMQQVPVLHSTGLPAGQLGHSLRVVQGRQRGGGLGKRMRMVHSGLHADDNWSAGWPADVGGCGAWAVPHPAEHPEGTKAGERI